MERSGRRKNVSGTFPLSFIKEVKRKDSKSHWKILVSFEWPKVSLWVKRRLILKTPLNGSFLKIRSTCENKILKYRVLVQGQRTLEGWIRNGEWPTHWVLPKEIRSLLFWRGSELRYIFIFSPRMITNAWLTGRRRDLRHGQPWVETGSLGNGKPSSVRSLINVKPPLKTLREDTQGRWGTKSTISLGSHSQVTMC